MNAEIPVRFSELNEVLEFVFQLKVLAPTNLWDGV